MLKKSNPNKQWTELSIEREYKVIKHNDLIQNSRHKLTTQEQKIILYIISKLKPTDNVFHLYEFKIKDFCEVCGIDETSGKNYSMLKETIQNLADKSIWVTLQNKENKEIETLIRWVERPYIERDSGTIRIKLDELMKPYLLELKQRFTVYNLYFILSMKSKYSIRIYELLKSYQNMGQCEFGVEDLKRMLFAENYKLFGHFREKVLEVATREINDFSDIFIEYECIKKERKFDRIHFKIKLKADIDERMKTFKKIEERIGTKIQ